MNINVGIIGFSLHEQEKFKRIFESALEHERTYTLKNLAGNEDVDLVIVKTAAESALKKLESLQQQYKSVPVVTAGKVPLEGFEYHIQGVLIVSRVLKILDSVKMPTETKAQVEPQQSSENLSVGGQYDILIVNEDRENSRLLKEELAKSDIPLNIDLAINDESAIKKINDKYYDFLFVDETTPNFDAIEQTLKFSTNEGVRSSVVMPTSKAAAIESSHVVLRVLKSFSYADDMATTGGESEEGIESYSVLIVDDSEMMHKALKIELDKADIILRNEYAFSGEEALEKLSHKYYDFIFLDVMMPGIDGFETCGKIRKIEGMSKVPIIMLTSKTSPLDEVKGVVAGCTTYLTKPVQTDDFQKMLTRIMRWLRDFKEGK